MRIAVLALLVTVLCACSDSGEPVPPPRLEGTWARACMRSDQGYQQTRISFDTSRFAIRTSLYSDDACTELRTSGDAVTSGSYIEVGRDDSGFAVQWDTFTDGPQDATHVELIPREFDVYAIQGDQLFYGDYTTGEGTSPDERPLNLGLPLVAVRIGDDTGDVL